MHNRYFRYTVTVVLFLGVTMEVVKHILLILSCKEVKCNLQKRYSQIDAECKLLEKKIAGLKSNDPVIIEEIARELNYIREGETVDYVSP